jgi:hypothetical protein
MNDEIIRYIRFKRGLPTTIARACGITRAAVYQWTHVPVAHVHTVAAILHLGPKDIRPDIFVAPGETYWSPLPHYISEPERWAELQRAAANPNTEYGEDL